MITYENTELMYPALDGLGRVSNLSCSCSDAPDVIPGPMNPAGSIAPTNANSDFSFSSVLSVLGISGLDNGLGCGSDCNCNCKSKKGKKGLGAFDSWYCQGTLAPLLFSDCYPPNPIDIAANDTSNSGSLLSPASQASVNATTINLVKNDPSLQQPSPTDYSNLLVIAAVILGVVVLIK
jgi:hypothetical protein